MKITSNIKSPTPKTKSFTKNFDKLLKDMVKNHENAASMVKETLSNNNISLDNLLKIQFETGLFFLKEQTFCKAAEQTANTIKNFTQMQI